MGHSGDKRDRPMVIAMIAVGVVQVPIHQVVHVVTMRNCLMATVGAMDMPGRMPRATVIGGAALRVLVGDR